MARSLQAYDGIVIAELIFYSIALVCGVLLCIKHGWLKNAGWRSIILLSLARIIGDCLRLATISDPNNESLYIGWMTLEGIGLAPMILLVLGYLSRIFDSASRQGQVFVQNTHQRVIELGMLVAMILLIIGGTQSSFVVSGGQPKVNYATLSKVGDIIIILVVALVFLEVFIAFRYQGYVAQGEHRIIAAAALTLPFIVVRLSYSCLLVLGGHTSSPWLYLGMSSIMEIIATTIAIVLGFTLEKVPVSAENHQNYDEEMSGMRNKLGPSTPDRYSSQDSRQNASNNRFNGQDTRYNPQYNPQ